MSCLRFISVALIVLSSLCFGGNDFTGTFNWPLKLKKQFSSGFGDTRPGRFHMGVDIRTGGKEGARVFAPEDGYIYRIKTSYTGYGKGLYLRGKSGRLYVFGHLQKYNWDIGTFLQKRQIADHRYYQDIYLKPTDLPVKKGDFIARTGQTGAGAPHLHFEIRDRDGIPINPFYFSNHITDRRAPTFEAIWLTYLDESSLFDNGYREKRLIPVKRKKSRNYVVSDTVLVIGRIAIKAAISDYVNKGSFRLGPSRIKLFIDDTLYHEVDYTKIPYDENIYSVLDKDNTPQKKDKYKRVYNLFRRRGNRFSGYKSDIHGDGSFKSDAFGLHHARVEALDAFGNKSTLDFYFYTSPVLPILQTFNKATITDSLIHLPFASDSSRNLFDSVAVYHPGGENSRPIRVFPHISITNSGVMLKGDFGQWTNYQVRFFKNNVPVASYRFSTRLVMPHGEKVASNIKSQVIGCGLSITAVSCQAGINWLMAEIVTDIRSVRLFFKKIGEKRFALYYTPDGNSTIIRSVITRGPVGFRPDTLALNIHISRPGEETSLTLRPGVELIFDDADLFNDALLSVNDTMMAQPKTGKYVFGPYVIEPEAYDFADWAELQTKIGESAYPAKTDLYVFDAKKGWQWAGGDYDAATGILRSKLGGTGVIAIISDTVAPHIRKINIPNRGQVKISHPQITFIVDDELSSIENDLNFNVTIDNKWLPPEYDPERKSFKTKPYWRLTPGSHTLRIEATDRCGNKRVVTRKFRVYAKPER